LLFFINAMFVEALNIKERKRKWLKEKVEKILSKISEIKNNIIVVVKDSSYFLFQS